MSNRNAFCPTEFIFRQQNNQFVRGQEQQKRTYSFSCIVYYTNAVSWMCIVHPNNILWQIPFSRQNSV